MISVLFPFAQTSDLSKQILTDFRTKHNISAKDHNAMLEEFGWSTHDFYSGFKG